MDIEDVPPSRQCKKVIGHRQAQDLFLEAFTAEKLHHAWLITGPRGVGKASLAFSMARFLLHNPPVSDDGPGLFGDVLDPVCPESLTTDPESPVNHRITAGSHPDLICIERSVDEKTGKKRNEILVNDVRRLQGFYNTTSGEGGWRVAIIDSADELNRNAANALLKILEEPPSNSILFVLAHAPGRLLPTIKSRCRQLRLKPLDYPEVLQVVSRQFPSLPAEEQQGCALLGDGSPGYAITLAEQKGLELYGQILTLMSLLPAMNVPALHALADDLAGAKNKDRFGLFTDLLTRFFNRLVRVNASPDAGVTEILTGELELMRSLGQRLPLDQWVELWEKGARILARTDAVNLDRKQVVLNIFSMISQSLRA
ncbi:DNA polymerase III subunit delta' [Emcibacter sp.]|uniref:DNA polymerase III subunit delta' n=1 Tax=Emcibacter sp. TaxID=1979954 RepID=UPI002AA82FC9|nr:DNA polymerase III subunit delta' [Emcibacter sp.]